MSDQVLREELLVEGSEHLVRSQLQILRVVELLVELLVVGVGGEERLALLPQVKLQGQRVGDLGLMPRGHGVALVARGRRVALQVLTTLLQLLCL